MRLRAPKIKQPKSEITKPKERPWQKFDVEVVTPIFGGGVTAGNPDEAMPIRTAAIRGQLRYWWRFLHQNKYKGRHLFDEERKIWGGVNEKETGFSSRVKLKVRHIKNINVTQYDGKSADYALFPAKETQKLAAKKLINEGIKFSLQIYSLESDLFSTNVLPALRWWATFGGIGARTRRGVGSIKIIGLDPITEDEAEAEGCKLVFAPSNKKLNAIAAWEIAVRYLQGFRQGENIGRRPGQGKKLGRSFWPEPDSIRQAIQDSEKKQDKFQRHAPEHDALISFPRAAFGLPIITQFTGGNEPMETELNPAGELGRMASPVILTPYPLKDGHYLPAALLMPTVHFNDFELALKYIGRIDEVALYKKDEWWNSNKANDVPPINNYAGSDALSAFMNFFAQGGRKP